jgi:membrane-associated phospholipid phosphatase
MDAKKILPVFSYIFHPIFISFYGTVFFFSIAKNFYYPPQIYVTLLQVVIVTLLLPLSMYFLFRSLGMLQSFTEASLKERQMPIAIQSILLFLLVKYSISKEVFTELYYFFLGGLISAVLVLAAVFLKFKASLHMMGISALTAFIYGLSNYYEGSLTYSIGLCILFMGCVASSRLYKKAHTPIELVAGILLGMLPQVALMAYWL